MEQCTFIRHLRNNPTPAERKLWAHLSARRLSGVRFNRQVKIGPYVADLASRSVKLAIELDGDSHATAQAKDALRTRFMETQGYRVIRFSNAEVMTNVEGVVAGIERILAELPSPSPSRQREGNALLPPSRLREGNALLPPSRLREGLGEGSATNDPAR